MKNAQNLRESLKRGAIFLLLLVFIFQPLGPALAFDDSNISDVPVFIPEPTEEAPASDTPTLLDLFTNPAFKSSPDIDDPDPDSEVPNIIPTPDAGEPLPEPLDSNADQDDLSKDSNLDNDKEETKTPDSPPMTESLSEQAGGGDIYTDSFTKPLLPHADNNTGTLIKEIPISIPPGRNNFQPDLKLVYNSQEREDSNVAGYGWTFNMPYIERINKIGTENLYSTSTLSYFYSSLAGDLALATSTASTSTYISRTDSGDNLGYSLANNQWLVTDKNGTLYKYGFSAAGRQDDPGNSSNIYKWMLEEVRDTNNNYIKYEYYKDGGQIYPATITYTGNGTTDGIFTISFLRELRSDKIPNYKTAFLVQTNYRIYEVDVNISGSWVTKYALAYSTGDNGYRSMLASVTQSGRDSAGNVTALPPIQFTYQRGTDDWTFSTSDYTWPTTTLSTIQGPYHFFDLNGDSLPDMTEYYYDSSNFVANTFLNNGNGTFTYNAGFNSPKILDSFQTRNGVSQIFDEGIRFLDFNGDGFLDLVQGKVDTNHSSSTFSAYLNNTPGWTASSTWAPGWGFANDSSSTGMRSFPVDMNADGLPDITDVQAQLTMLDSGAGFATSSVFMSFPNIGFVGGSAYGDVNSDGLPDMVSSYFSVPGGSCNPLENPYNNPVNLNNGRGSFTSTSTWASPAHWSPDCYNEHTLGGLLLDINGDSLTDLTIGSTTYLNAGNGFATSSLAIGYCSETWRIDINGDGLPDCAKIYVDAQSIFHFETKIHQGVIPDLLSTINYPGGATTTITYQRANQYKDGSGNLLNPGLSAPVDTVASISTTDGNGNTMSNAYTYAGGKYYYSSPLDRRFGGFQTITDIDALGNVTKKYFHTGVGSDSSHGEYQDNYWKIGKPYRVEAYDNAGHLFEKVINKWDSATSTANSLAGFVKLVQTVDSAYDGQASHKDKAATYTYNNTTGNQTQRVEYGQVSGSDDGSFSDTGTDDFTTNISYASSGASSILSLPSNITITDHNASKVKETRYYYDNQALGVMGSKGNQTKKEDWKTASSYINTQKTYDGTYGLVSQSQDPRGKQTNYTYDSYNLYPTTVTNPLSQATLYAYNYSGGKVATTTDPNGNIFVRVFDGLNRVLQTKQPNPSSTSTLETNLAYTYTDTSGAFSVHQANYLTSTATVDTYLYFDGLHRPIQTRKAGESSYETKDQIYDNRGQLQKESLPYFSSGSSKTTATSTSALFTSYVYDPLNRIATSANILGTSTNTYLNWKITITDPNGKIKDLFNDAYGNLIEVDEHNGSSTYATIYTYDGLNDLTVITDALNNVRNFSYDGLGRRLTAQDLHSSGDATYGSYSYTYDDANNLTQKVDPKSQTINYTYDDINRPLTEDYTGQSGTEVTYAYDSCLQGKGRLCTASSSAVSIANAYDALGRISISTSTISSVAYPTSYTYDRQGNQLTITNPDNSQLKYIYNAAGLVDQVQRKESTDGGFTNVVSNFDYSPTEQPTTVSYANGVTTTNIYDPTKLYRLARKTSTLPSASKAQDIAYTYDAVGNITQIVNASVTSASSTMAYGYDDLYRLTSATATNTPGGISGYTQTFSYDALGNIINKSDYGNYSYLGNNGSNYANPEAATIIGASALAYDNNGNLTSITATTTISNWQVNGGTWNRRRPITIDHTKVSGTSTLSNFPILFNTTDAEFKTTANGGYVASSTGADIFFTSSDGSTKLSHELEKYSSSTGETIAWIKVPSLSTSTDTVLYMFYGNASSGNQQNATGTWDSNYIGVYHLSNGITLSANDSTSNVNNGTVNSASAVTGNIDGAASFSGSTSSYISVPDNSNTRITEAVTLSGWLYLNGSTFSGYTGLIRKGSTSDYQPNNYMLQGLSGLGTVELTYSHASNNNDYMSSNSSVAANGWTYLSAVIDTPNAFRAIYMNGLLNASTTISTQAMATSTDPVWLGKRADTGLNGYLDEVHISKTARSGGWVGTEYANQSSPSTFYSLGSGVGGSGEGGSGPSNWYSTGGTWTNRKAITLDHTKVSGTSTLSNFPVLVNTTDADLKIVANGGKVASSTGADILFTSSDGLTKLSHELEKYSSSTGETIAWVKIPTLATTTDTTLYMYYGNSSSGNQQNVTGVWDSNYKGVWHAPNGTTLSGSDSTSNANTLSLTGSPTATTGKIDGGAGLNGTSQYGSHSNVSTVTDNLTMSAWVKVGGYPASRGYVVNNGQGDGNGYAMFVNPSGVYHLDIAFVADLNSNTTLATNTWYSLAATRNSGTWRVYVNGAQAGSTISNNPNGLSGSTTVGADLPGSGGSRFYLNGTVDEARFSTTPRSADWIATEYNNQSTTTMLSFSSQETYSSSSASSTLSAGAFTWDYNNRLTQAATNNATSTYSYDPSGQRVKMTVATGTSVTTYYPTKNYNITGSTPTKNILLPDGKLIATVVGTGTSSVVSYIHTDHLSGANVSTNASGTAIQLLDYYPYGSKRLNEGTDVSQREFTGHEYDADTGLLYANARYYNSSNGRFISQDPAFQQVSFALNDPQSMNSYAYARNNPLRYVDPNGKWFKDLIMGRQSWSSFAVEVGDAANYLYDNSGTWQAAMDHPYVAGAVVGVAGGVVAAGGALAAEAVAPAVSDIAGGMTVGRSATGAGLNLASKYIEGKLDNRKVSAGEYLFAGVTGAVGTSKYFDGLLSQAGYASISNLAGQAGFKGYNNVDWASVGISGLSSGLTTKMMGVPSQNAVPQVYRFITEQVVVWTTDTAGQTMNSGIQSSNQK